MGNFETIKAITDNLQTVLKAKGINFDRETDEDLGKVPAGVLPLGLMFYRREEFEEVHSQRMSYVDVVFLLRVILGERDSIDVIREQQKWNHNIHGAVTVNALNIGDLVSTKLVKLVTTEDNDPAQEDGMALLNYTLRVRYRET